MNQDPRFTDLMQEIKERLYVIEDLLGGKTGLQGPLSHEFCYLQLRLICECIAYACVIANAYIKELQVKRNQKQYSASMLMTVLDELHKNFYPKPVKIEVIDDAVHLEDIKEPFLTKNSLKKLYALCGEKLHRGSPEKYTYDLSPEQIANDRAHIIDYGNKIFRLMESYLISSKDNSKHILCRFKERGTKVEVFFCA